MSSVKINLEGDAYRDLIVSIDGFIHETTAQLSDIEETVADIQRVMQETQADLSLVMKKVGAVGILAAGGSSEKEPK